RGAWRCNGPASWPRIHRWPFGKPKKPSGAAGERASRRVLTSRMPPGGRPRCPRTEKRASRRSMRSGSRSGPAKKRSHPPVSDLPARISLREVGPRDGLQNEDPVPTGAKVALIDALSGTGVQRIEAVSFVHPKAIPQMADADEVWQRIRRADGVRYSALVPNSRGAARALGAGFTEVEAVVSA